eukprot:CAMPEP_0206368830 /NCGR_PEP_ID=MMETSP0294-20121207/4918_1 /ASSEMBLY_ACC=CAM_ASM_000327 /TAXON_ID=39354 /ORGANISM="Heterosigma akashiwo, Strain CCMP2393" /LENGTH=195 /DNA_ID=CAMNT_0053815435 /DNA_START=38 /DNA_END=627 /DNA_ORIENTATION=+
MEMCSTLSHRPNLIALPFPTAHPQEERKRTTVVVQEQARRVAAQQRRARHGVRHAHQLAVHGAVPAPPRPCPGAAPRHRHFQSVAAGVVADQEELPALLLRPRRPARDNRGRAPRPAALLGRVDCLSSHFAEGKPRESCLSRPLESRERPRESCRLAVATWNQAMAQQSLADQVSCFLETVIVWNETSKVTNVAI